ncbi:MAG: hypothetical protein J6D04_02150 [Clostridia bacterium]|nr:hypothetical protein [Clostridia bacterium]
MKNKLTVHIHPITQYLKSQKCDYTLCRIDFDFNYHGPVEHFEAECNNLCLQKMIKNLDTFLSGKREPKEFHYEIPWIIGEDCVYRYSFKPVSKDCLAFLFKLNEYMEFKCHLNKDEVLSLRNQLQEELKKADWDSFGKAPLYTFSFPEKPFSWCYSAQELCENLKSFCSGKCIRGLYVSAQNYSDPVQTHENWVDYYLGSEVIVQLDDVLLDLMIHAEGLVEWRSFATSEYTLNGPTVKQVNDWDEEFCKLGNAWGVFTSNYTDTPILDIRITETKCFPWYAKGFDESKIKSLPKEIAFLLSNDHSLTLYGVDDDFVIELKPQ